MSTYLPPANTESTSFAGLSVNTVACGVVAPVGICHPRPQSPSITRLLVPNAEPSLDGLIETGRQHIMTSEEKAAQIESFARGNVGIHQAENRERTEPLDQQKDARHE